MVCWLGMKERTEGNNSARLLIQHNPACGRGLGLDDPWRPFQPEPFCDPVCTVSVRGNELSLAPE